MGTQSFGLRDLGRSRKNNEDYVVWYEPDDPEEKEKSGSLYIIADGVGGAAKGERASESAATKVLYEYYQPENLDLEPLDRLRLLMERANDEIYTYASDNHTRMATTMVAAVVRGQLLHVANVGDSRAYLIRDGVVKQLNRDHSLVGELVENGEMTEEQAMASKIKNRLTRSLGGDPEVKVDVYKPIALKSGDQILLCSDGLTRYAAKPDLVKLMNQKGSPEEISKRLVGFANRQGGADNISVVVAEYLAGDALSTTMKTPKGEVPLDSLATEYGDENIRKRRRSTTIAIVISLLALALVVVPLMFWEPIMGVVGRWLPTTPTLALTEAVPSLPPAYPAPAVEADTSADPVIPIFTNTGTPASSLPIAVSTAIPEDKKVCAYLTQPNNTLGIIMSKFDQSYTVGSPYFFCIMNADNSQCMEMKVIDNPDQINPGNWILIPAVSSQTACDLGGGVWVLDVAPK
jgi:PPM family protein phosphatase